MRVLVCGGRDWLNYQATAAALDKLPVVPSIVIHGGAKGADTQAEVWAHFNDIHTARVVALWENFGKPAGGKRNTVMLLLQPEYVVAFPGSRGTADMVRRAQAVGLPVWQPYG